MVSLMPPVMPPVSSSNPIANAHDLMTTLSLSMPSEPIFTKLPGLNLSRERPSFLPLHPHPRAQARDATAKTQFDVSFTKSHGDAPSMGWCAVWFLPPTRVRNPRRGGASREC